jgi:predicted peptidase
MTRGKTTELILKVREYSKSKTPLSYLSAGCESPQSLSSGNFEIQVAGKSRTYIMYSPRPFSREKPGKLILALHGRTNSNTMVQDYMGIEDQNDFLVVYPAGLSNGKAFSWSEGENITFMDALVQKVSDTTCIERNQIFIVAHSMGAGFSSKLVCQRGDTFRGMSIVGGGGWSSGCNSTPTASLIYQRPDDRLSAPESARVTERTMKNINMCKNTSESIQIGSNSCQKWNDCSSGNPVIWCEKYPTYGNDPHSWPTKSAGGDIVEFLGGLK